MSIPKVIIHEDYNLKFLADPNGCNVLHMRNLRYLGNRVKSLREDFGWSQQTLADMMARQGEKVTQATINHIENNNRKPSVEVLVTMAITLQVTSDYLLGLSDDQSPPEGRIISEDQLRLESAFRLLSPLRQRELLVIANALAEDEEAPPADSYDKAIEAALDLVETIGNTELMLSLWGELDSAAPSLARRLRRRKQSGKE